MSHRSCLTKENFVINKTPHTRLMKSALFKLYKITSSSGDTAAALFNNLPDNLKKCDHFNLFSLRIFKFLKNRAQASLS